MRLVTYADELGNEKWCELSPAIEERVKELVNGTLDKKLRWAVNQGVKFAEERSHFHKWVRLEESIANGIKLGLKREWRLLLDIASQKPKARQSIVDFKQKKSEQERKLFMENRGLKERRRKLIKSVQFWEQRQAAVAGDMPLVPEWRIEVPTRGDNESIPERSGIYFLFEDGAVAYVGQSINLRARISVGHHNYNRGDTCSWLEFPQEKLTYSECYYIWATRPWRNGGTPKRSGSLISC